MRFSDIPGHEEVKTRLRQLVDEQHIPHALLLEGPEGVGKHALARAFLQYVSCRNRHDGDSCGQCPACVQHGNMQYIDAVYTFPYVKLKGERPDKLTLASDYMTEFIEFVKESPYMDATVWHQYLGEPNSKPQIFVGEAAELVRRLSYAPRLSKYNMVLMWQADSLRDDAANKLLKIIEEPPGDAVIVMTSAKPGNILPTIYSRVQRVKVKRLSDDDIAAWMVDKCSVDPETAADLAPLAQGSFIEATRRIANKDNSVRYLEYFISLMRLAYKRDIAALKDWSFKLATLTRDEIVAFLEYMAVMIRENFVANLNRPPLNLMNKNESDFSRNFARFINERNVEALFDATSRAISDIRSNVNPKIVLFDLSITVILKLKE